MHVTLVHVSVNLEDVDAFIAATAVLTFSRRPTTQRTSFFMKPTRRPPTPRPTRKPRIIVPGGRRLPA